MQAAIPAGNGYVEWKVDYELRKIPDANWYEGAWNHWAFVKNGDTGYQRIYHNGVQFHSVGSQTDDIGTIDGFKIGAKSDKYNKDYDGTYNYDGKIDDFRIYDYELDVNDINDIYQAGL